MENDFFRLTSDEEEIIPLDDGSIKLAVEPWEIVILKWQFGDESHAPCRGRRPKHEPRG